MRCWSEVSRKTEWTIQGLGLTLFPPRYTIRAAHTNYLHANSLLTLIGLFSAHVYAQVGRLFIHANYFGSKAKHAKTYSFVHSFTLFYINMTTVVKYINIFLIGISKNMDHKQSYEFLCSNLNPR